jgi:pyridoxamine 5'-phosphate oxidase like protein
MAAGEYATSNQLVCSEAQRIAPGTPRLGSCRGSSEVDGDGAEYWDTPGGRVATMISFAKAKVTGQPYDGGENEQVSL